MRRVHAGERWHLSRDAQQQPVQEIRSIELTSLTVML
jgi:hypothetical protein